MKKEKIQPEVVSPYRQSQITNIELTSVQASANEGSGGKLCGDLNGAIKKTKSNHKINEKL